MITNAGREAWRCVFDLFFDGEAHERIHAACASLDVPPGVLKVMLHLSLGEGVPMRDLAQRLSCDASYVTSLADILEERGFAERRAHPTDRRVKIIALTPAGEAARRQGLAIMHEPPASFGALTAAEQRQLRDLLQRVTTAEVERADAATGGS